MTTFPPILIAVVIMSPLLPLIVYLHRYIHRNEQPDRARLRGLRGLLWFVTALMAAYAFSVVILSLRGSYSYSISGSPLLVLSGSLTLTSIIVSQIQRCRRRLRKP
jgi:hypothetical protein